MSFGDTWTSPPLQHATRRAVSPARALDSRQLLVAARCEQQALSDATPKSKLLEHRFRPMSAKTINPLTSAESRPYSSFTPDGTFPVAVCVANPLYVAESPMTRQLKIRQRRLDHRQQRAAAAAEHERCCTELETLQASTGATMVASLNSRRPLSAAATPAAQLLLAAPAGKLASSCNLPGTTTGHRDTVTATMNSSFDNTMREEVAASEPTPYREVIVLRVETPLPSHPLACRPATAGVQGRGYSAAGVQRPAVSATGSVCFSGPPIDGDGELASVVQPVKHVTRRTMPVAYGNKSHHHHHHHHGNRGARSSPGGGESALALDTIVRMERASTPAVSRPTTAVGTRPQSACPTGAASPVTQSEGFAPNAMLRAQRPASAAASFVNPASRPASGFRSGSSAASDPFLSQSGRPTDEPTLLLSGMLRANLSRPASAAVPDRSYTPSGTISRPSTPGLNLVSRRGLPFGTGIAPPSAEDMALGSEYASRPLTAFAV
jgi:hypothetical protein